MTSSNSGTTLRADRPITGIDSHAHVFVHGLSLAARRRYAPTYEVNIEDYRSMLASLGLSHGVLVQPSFLGTDNSFLLSCLDAYPGQLRGIVVVDPARDLDEVDRWHSRGVVGVRANLIGEELPDFREPAWRTLLERMSALDWHLELHVEAARLSRIAPALLESGVRIVVDHFGRFDPTLGMKDPAFRDLLALADTRRVWVKVSGAYRVSQDRSDPAAALAAAASAWTPLLQEFGTERMVWGTDWPHTQFESVQTPRMTRDLLEAVVKTPEHLQALLVDTPRSLFQFA